MSIPVSDCSGISGVSVDGSFFGGCFIFSPGPGFVIEPSSFLLNRSNPVVSTKFKGEFPQYPYQLLPSLAGSWVDFIYNN